MTARLRQRDEAGVTLVELLVTMVLLSIVSAIVLAATMDAQKVYRSDNDESQGLADVKTVVERLGRDVRDARGVSTGATSSQLTLWIDSNSNYRQDADELVTWKIVDVSGSTCTLVGHCDVVRSVPGKADVIEARTLISNFAFAYDLTAPDTRLVTVTMQYDALRGAYGTGARTVTFSERLRNVA